MLIQAKQKKNPFTNFPKWVAFRDQRPHLGMDRNSTKFLPSCLCAFARNPTACKYLPRIKMSPRRRFQTKGNQINTLSRGSENIVPKVFGQRSMSKLLLGKKNLNILKANIIIKLWLETKSPLFRNARLQIFS